MWRLHFPKHGERRTSSGPIPHPLNQARLVPSKRNTSAAMAYEKNMSILVTPTFHIAPLNFTRLRSYWFFFIMSLIPCVFYLVN